MDYLSACKLEMNAAVLKPKNQKNNLGKSARETISAFSNEPGLGGGYLVLGLKRNDDSTGSTRYTLAGVHNPDKLQCELTNACRTEFNVRISPEIQVEFIDGVPVVVAFIPESFARDKPVFIKKLDVKKGAFRRIGSSDHRCTAHDLDFLYQLRSGIPYYSTDYREPLITLLPRLHAQIMGDLPKLFGLEEGEFQRTDTPTIPRNVIREALSNALMHRDYRAGQPTLIIRYSNRLEFKNAGYSLKPFEELGQPGSKQRNLIIATVFHDLNYAESKGTGIGSMKEWMRKAGLTTPPIIETNRDSNEFDLVLLSHHLLDQKDLEWLAQFNKEKLSDAERRALVLAREMRAITNQDYRQINGVDTLTASRALCHLRDLGLLTMKGSGNGTYYTLTKAENLSDQQVTPYINPLHKESTPYINPLHKGLVDLPERFPELPPSLAQEISNLPKRCLREKIKEIIKKLCKITPLKPNELGRILNRDPQYLRIHFLSKMIENKELIYLYPENPAHPKQAYTTPSENQK